MKHIILRYISKGQLKGCELMKRRRNNIFVLGIVEITLVLTSILIFSFIYNGDVEQSIYFKEAKLSEQEENMVALVADQSFLAIYDFNVEHNVPSAQMELKVNVYSLDSDNWEHLSTVSRVLDSISGRVMFEFDGNCIYSSIQSDGLVSRSAFSLDDYVVDDGIFITNFFEGSYDMEMGEEVAVALQVISVDEYSTGSSVDSFYEPDAFSEFEYAYAITVQFDRSN